jgi:putative membrane protein
MKVSTSSTARIMVGKMISMQQRYMDVVSRRCISSTAARFAGDATDVVKEVLKPEFYVPKKERGSGSRDVFAMDTALGETRLVRNDRRCPTRELNFTPVQWGKHKNPWRRIRHIANIFRSSPFQRLMFPDLLGVATVAGCLTYYNEFIASIETAVSMSNSGFAGATTAIGLLAGFRLNASYGRYEECRIFWGDINNTIRDLAMETMMWMQDENQRARMLKLCKAFPLTHMFHLHAKGCHHNIKRTSTTSSASFADRVHAEFEAELRDIYSDGKDEYDFARISRIKYGGGNTPLEILTMMRETIAGSVGSVESIYVRELDEQCQRLCAAYGASERVLRTPLPTGFTRHSSRLLFLWSHLLPFALYPTMGPFLTLPTAILTSYAILGIEDIGVQLEEPFDILPLRQYSDGMFDAIDAINNNYIPYVIGEERKM